MTPKERPVICTAHEVRGLLDGTVTQLWRPMSPQPPFDYFAEANRGILYGCIHPGGAATGWVIHPREPGILQKQTTEERIYCPFGVPGDRLWVQENVLTPGPWNIPEACKLWYPADGPCPFDEAVQGRTPQTMPRWASRLTLELTGVRATRVHAATDDELVDGCAGAVWDSRWHKNYPWVLNPWAWVLTVKKR